MANRSTLSKMTQQEVLNILGTKKMQWFDLWEDKKIQRIYHRLRRHDDRFQITPGSAKHRPSRIWQSESTILTRIQQKPEWFSPYLLDKEYEEWSKSDHVAYAVQELIENCKYYPVFEDEEEGMETVFNKTKVRAALALLMKIYHSCKGRKMSAITPQGGKADRLGPVITSEKNDWYQVLERRVMSWMGKWTEDGGVIGGVQG
jgi:hypothetical protein